MKKSITFFLLLFTLSVIPASFVFASSYNQGIYNENVPYGSATYLAISTDGDISIPVTPTSTGTQVTGTSHVTVTSTDVVGYKLYLRSSSSTNMDNLGDTLPTSANVSPAALSMDTWGYNTDGSSNFVGSSLTDTLIRTFTGPAPTGDITTVTYGMKVDLAKPAGNYTTAVVYTAAPDTD
ncbi:MAG TPA: hypothetical protein VMT96_01075 [Candidatus Bathyarchaeia archaeon]|nr:hypothetical protein [Candidatus Bathyarchaeia archaeon]